MLKRSSRRYEPGGEIVYQIFPDRWLNSRPDDLARPGGDGREIALTRDHELLTTSPTSQRSFFGGDLDGIRRGLPYLRDLGVTTLYLNPIFAAAGAHRYDTTDYFRIDPILGDRKDFENLAHALRDAGMLLFLDGVLNHTSDRHAWHASPRERRRRYIMKTAEETMTWLGRGGLPKLDTQNPRVVRDLLDVLAAWPEADGWRLDAAHLLPADFLRAVKRRITPRPVIIEDWTLAPHYFKEKLGDGLTNFCLRDNLKGFFTEDCSPETLLDRLRLWIAAYPARNLGTSWTFLDNHDTDRFLSLAGRPRLFRALVLLFTLPGSPLLYHGIEIGMTGRNAAESRTPMEWDESRQDRELLGHVERLAKLRRGTTSLARGTFKPLFADNRSRTFLFERRIANERTRVGMNDGYLPCRLPPGPGPRRLGPGEWFVLVEKKGRKPELIS